MSLVLKLKVNCYHLAIIVKNVCRSQSNYNTLLSISSARIIEPPTYCYQIILAKLYLNNKQKMSLKRIIWLLSSLLWWSQVILLSGRHCTMKLCYNELDYNELGYNKQIFWSQINIYYINYNEQIQPASSGSLYLSLTIFQLNFRSKCWRHKMREVTDWDLRSRMCDWRRTRGMSRQGGRNPHRCPWGRLRSKSSKNLQVSISPYFTRSCFIQNCAYMVFL